MASLSGFGTFAGGLAQGFQGGAQTALTWAGLHQRQQQIEMQRQQQEFENDFKTLSAVVPLMDPKKFSGKTVDSASKTFLEILSKHTDVSGIEFPTIEDRKLEEKLQSEASKDLTSILQNGMKQGYPASHIMQELSQKMLEYPDKIKDALKEQEALKNIQETVKQYGEEQKAETAQEAIGQRVAKTLEETKRHHQAIEKARAVSEKRLSAARDKIESASNRKMNIAYRAAGVLPDIKTEDLTPEQAQAILKNYQGMNLLEAILLGGAGAGVAGGLGGIQEFNPETGEFK